MVMIDITLYFTFLASTSLLLLCPSSSFVVRPASGHAEKLKVAASSSVGGSSGITQIKARGQEDDHAAPAAGFLGLLMDHRRLLKGRRVASALLNPLKPFKQFKTI